VSLELVRYWFEFNVADSLRRRMGVTAWTLDDARLLLSERVFDGQELPPVIAVVEGVDVSTLSEGHVQPNMAAPNERGVWYPLGFQ
jgi:hypothetical protein